MTPDSIRLIPQSPKDAPQVLPAAAVPELGGLKVWPPESLGATLEAFSRRNRIKLHPGEAYTWTGQVKQLRGQRSRKGQHHIGRPRAYQPKNTRGALEFHDNIERSRQHRAG